MTVVDVDAQQVQALLAPLWSKNRASVLGRLVRVRRALAADDVDGAVREDIHALIGTLGTYGWPEGSRLIEQVRECLGEPATSRRELIRRLDELTSTLTDT